MHNVLETENLTKWYGTSKVVDGVNIEIKPGEIYGLIGKNGAGKTTIMKLVLSLIKPNDGKVKLFGEVKGTNAKLYNKVGALIEMPAFYPFFTAEQNLEYYKILKGLDYSFDIRELLAKVGLEDVGSKKYKHFSLGMKQRLGIALALLGNPEFLILDEPINGLDPEGIKEVRDLLIKQNQEFGTTIFISSHILSELSQLATKFGVIHEGKLLAEIENKELKTDLETYFLDLIKGK